MRAVILASGRSQRLQPVPDKVALKFCGKTLLEYQVQQLCNHGFTELYIIYGAHNKETVTRITANLALKVTLVEQEDLTLGMAGAIASLSAVYPDTKPFTLLSSNDIIAATGVKLLTEAISANPQNSYILAKTVQTYFPGGYLQLAENNLIKTIVEKPSPGQEPSDLVNLVYHYHAEPQALFEQIASTIKTKAKNNQDLYEQSLQALFDSAAHGNYYALAYKGPWQTIKYPWHLYNMAKYLFEQETKSIHPTSEIAATAVIEGPVIIAKGVKIMHNAVIKGPVYLGENTIVANNALVRDSFIGADSVIGYNSEIARSYLQDEVWTHTNYIGDSVIGNNVSFGAGTVTGNLRLDEQPISVEILGQSIETGANKLGLITGDNIRVGIQTSFMPGVKLGSNSMVGANLAIAEDIPDQSFVKGETKLSIRPNTKIIPSRNNPK